MKTSQIGWMSRKRTKRTERTIPSPVARTTRSEHDRDQLEPLDPWRQAVRQREHEHGDEVHPEVEQRGERHRQRDHHPREAHLAQQRLALNEALHATRRRLGEIGPQHDPGEQVDAVVGDALADLEDDREDEVQHAEEQQRPHQRPQVPERRTEVAQLELGPRERQRQLDETGGCRRRGLTVRRAGAASVLIREQASSGGVIGALRVSGHNRGGERAVDPARRGARRRSAATLSCAFLCTAATSTSWAACAACSPTPRRSSRSSSATTPARTRAPMTSSRSSPASTEPSTTVYYLRRERNLGFPANVNGAFDLTAPADVVVLNSDVVVAEGWLEGMREAAYADSRVATATALTNHGSLVSVPNRRPVPALPAEWSLDAASAVVRARSLKLRPRLPTAIGHCIYVRRSALELVGDVRPRIHPRLWRGGRLLAALRSERPQPRARRRCAGPSPRRRELLPKRQVATRSQDEHEKIIAATVSLLPRQRPNA